MTSRYDDRDQVRNRNFPLLNRAHDRRLKKRSRWLVHYTSPELKHPTDQEFADLTVQEHIWKQGDRYWKLASEAYGDSSLWWVIAWFNQKPTEAHSNIGDIVYIPFPLHAVLGTLGV